MRLLYITNGINGSGGLERVLSIKASLLAEQYDYTIGILVLNDAHKDPFYTFSAAISFYSISVGGNPLSYLRSYKKGIQNVVDTFNPDIISVCDDGLKGFFLPKWIKSDAKWIYERHVSKLIESNDKHSFSKKMITKSKWALMEKLAKNYAKFIVLTEGNKQEWPSLKNIKVMPNPLPFQSGEIADQEQKRVISVGRIAYQKGQDLLIQAWEKVHKKYPEWELHLYGKENLAFLDTKNLKHNIHFFPPVRNIEEKYLDSSIYVMSSRFEGFGMVLIEAMEYALPCVSFNCDYGPSDIIKDGEDGFLVAKENTEELAEKILYLIENPEKRQEMGAKAKRNVQRFQAANIVENWHALFQELRASN